MKVQSAGATDVGRRREHNEDCFAIVESEQLYVVADGMGGHAFGEVASKMAIDTIVEFFERTAGRDPTPPQVVDLPAAAARLVGGIRLANQRIFGAATEGKQGMGTTIVGALLSGRTMYLAHAGDSRAYLIRAGHIAQLTRDHSWLEEFKQTRPDLTDQELRNFPYRNVILRALGTLPEVQVDVRSVEAAPGDIFLLCCDGLNTMIEDDRIEAIINQTPDLAKAAAALISAANEAGGEDNITVILARCEAG